MVEGNGPVICTKTHMCVLLSMELQINLVCYTHRSNSAFTFNKKAVGLMAQRQGVHRSTLIGNLQTRIQDCPLRGADLVGERGGGANV